MNFITKSEKFPVPDNLRQEFSNARLNVIKSPLVQNLESLDPWEYTTALKVSLEQAQEACIVAFYLSRGEREYTALERTNQRGAKCIVIARTR